MNMDFPEGTRVVTAQAAQHFSSPLRGWESVPSADGGGQVVHVRRGELGPPLELVAVLTGRQLALQCRPLGLDRVDLGLQGVALLRDGLQVGLGGGLGGNGGVTLGLHRRVGGEDLERAVVLQVGRLHVVSELGQPLAEPLHVRRVAGDPGNPDLVEEITDVSEPDIRVRPACLVERRGEVDPQLVVVDDTEWRRRGAGGAAECCDRGGRTEAGRPGHDPSGVDASDECDDGCREVNLIDAVADLVEPRGEHRDGAIVAVDGSLLVGIGVGGGDGGHGRGCSFVDRSRVLPRAVLCGYGCWVGGWVRS